MDATAMLDDSPVIVWRKGTWFDCLSSLETVAAKRGWHNLHVAIAQAFTEHELRHDVTVQRSRRIGSLAASLMSDPGSGARLEAARAQIVSDRMQITAQLAPLVTLALQDPALSDTPVTRAHQATIRAATIEDVEQVFDYDAMAECTRLMVSALLVQAHEERRFDDYRMAVRFIGLYVDGGIGDGRGKAELGILLLAYLLESSAFSAEDARERFDQVGRLRALLGRLRVPEQNHEVIELLDAADGLTLESIDIKCDHHHYDAVLDRIETAFSTTKNTSYLEDLILYCRAPRPGESLAQQARRLSDLAAFTAMRGRTLHRRSDLVAAIRLQEEVLDTCDVDNPSLAHYRMGAAIYRLNLLRHDRAPIASALTDLAGFLPELPYNPNMGSGETLGGAYVVRAAAELTAARETDSDRETQDQLLANAIAAGEAARFLLASYPTSHMLRESTAFVVAARAAQLLHRPSPPSASDLEDLAELVADPRAASEGYETALGVAAEIARVYRIGRRSIRAALVRARAVVSAQPDERLAQFYTILRLALVLALDDDDVARSDAARKEVLDLVRDLLRAATFVARTDPTMSSSTNPLAEAAQLIRDVAVRFASLGLPSMAALLAEASSSIRATDTLLSRDRGIEATTRFEQDRAATTVCSSLIVLSGSGSVAVLTRQPAGEWECASFDSSAARDHFAAVDWSNPDEFENVFMLKDELTELSHVLGRMLGAPLLELQKTATKPILCLPTGSAATFAVGLVYWSRPDFRHPLVVAPGFLTDGIVESVTRPNASEAQVLMLAGAPKLQGGGVIDPKSDIEAIESAGLTISVMTSAVNIDDSLRTADIVHYVGHLVPAGPDDTALLFADDSALLLTEIRMMRLNKTRLATLIACYTGLGPTSAAGPAAEQIEHAAGAFLEAGVDTVVAALWPVFDRPASMFTHSFYRALADGASTADAFTEGVAAIRDHRIGTIRPYAHPVHWAGFTLFAGTGSWWQADKDAVMTLSPYHYRSPVD